MEKEKEQEKEGERKRGQLRWGVHKGTPELGGTPPMEVQKQAEK